MIVFLISMALGHLALYVMHKLYGFLAALVVIGLPMINLVIDHLIAGNQTVFRQVYFLVYAFAVIVASFKTIKRFQ